MSEKAHHDEVMAVLTAAGAVPYDLGKVPGTRGNSGSLPKWYTEVSVSRRYGGNPRTGKSSTQGYRITTRAVADSAANARNMRAKQHAALEAAVLTIDGEQTTAIQFETAEPISFDEGYYSGLTAWTYAH